MPPKKRSHPYKRRTGMIPKKITFTSPLIDLCESPPSTFSSLETAELVKIPPLEVSRVLNPNFITPPAPRATPIWPQLLSPTLNPSFFQPPRISTRVFATLGLPTDNVPTVLYSHLWSSNSNFPSFAPLPILTYVLSYPIPFLILQFFLNPLPLDTLGLILMNPGPLWDHSTIATR